MPERPRPDLNRVRQALTERDDAVPEPETPEEQPEDEQEGDADA